MAKVSLSIRQALLQRLWIILTSLILPLIPAMMTYINIYVLPIKTTVSEVQELKTEQQK